jgi:hypothetical protein
MAETKHRGRRGRVLQIANIWTASCFDQIVVAVWLGGGTGLGADV